MLRAHGLPLVVTVSLVALLQGCGGCGGSAPPTAQRPPQPVQGNLPKAQEAAPAQAQEAKDACAVLIFSTVESGPAPLSAQLSAEGDCTKGTARFEWDFGDGSPKATGDTVVHTFEKPGTYTVKGRITSSDLPGVEDSDDVQIVVVSPQS